MSVEIFAIAYNEEILLPHFLRHYKDSFDVSKITIFDNKSTDSTRGIAIDAGCEVKTFDTNNQIRDDNYLFVKNNCWKNSKADFVIIVDIDEFLEVNFELNNTKHTIITTHGYDIIGDVYSRLGVHNNMYNKICCFSPKHISEIRYLPGCHSCSPVGSVTPSAPANLMHRKYISEEYVYKRHLMYQNRLSEMNKKYGWGIEYQNVTLGSVQKKFEELRKNAKLVV